MTAAWGHRVRYFFAAQASEAKVVCFIEAGSVEFAAPTRSRPTPEVLQSVLGT